MKISFLFCVVLNRIVPNLDEDSPSSKSESSDPEDGPTTITLLTQKQESQPKLVNNIKAITVKCNSAEDDAIGDGLRQTTIIPIESQSPLERTNSLPFISGQVERRRRKLPEIPKNKRCNFITD